MPKIHTNRLTAILNSDVVGSHNDNFELSLPVTQTSIIHSSKDPSTPITIVFQKTDIIKMPTKFGKFKMVVYKDLINNKDYTFVFQGEPNNSDDFVIRMHSECLTGDVFGSFRCDCGEQLSSTLEHINEKGYGGVIYLPQEGRGIGLFNKIIAYKLQENGYNTIEANHKLGFETDLRDFSFASMIIKDLKINSIDLLTNNPDKVNQLKEYGTNVSKTTQARTEVQKYNKNYLEVKKIFMNHDL